MAIYNTTNVKDLPQLEEVVNGNYLIIENQFGSNIIDFKDFVIGPNNASFYNTIVSLSGYAVSMSATTNAGFNSVSATLISLSATVDSQFRSVSARITSLSATVDTKITSATAALVVNYPRFVTIYASLSIANNQSYGEIEFNSELDDVQISDINIVPIDRSAAELDYYLILPTPTQNIGEPKPYVYTLGVSSLQDANGRADFRVKIQK